MKKLMENWRRYKRIAEASYDGNIGFEETVRFYQTAPKEKIAEFEALLDSGDEKSAMGVVLDFLDVSLHGDQFSHMKDVAEAISLDIEVGDVLLGGKYKNKRIEVKEIGEDELGQPTVNGKPILKVRIEKHLPDDKKSKKTLDMERDKEDKS